MLFTYEISDKIFLFSPDATTCSSQKKAEIIGQNFSTPFLRCVSNLQTAKSMSDVLETILGLSAAYDLTQQALQLEQEETFDLTSYFYNEQVLFSPRLALSAKPSCSVN